MVEMLWMSALDSEPLDLLQHHQEQAQTNHRTCMTMHDLNFTAHKQENNASALHFLGRSLQAENLKILVSSWVNCTYVLHLGSHVKA